MYITLSDTITFRQFHTGEVYHSPLADLAPPLYQIYPMVGHLLHALEEVSFCCLEQYKYYDIAEK